MLIKTLKLKNFKRFADLEINLDPENSGNLPKLVLLIGANGSGKSSIFDGFEITTKVLHDKEDIQMIKSDWQSNFTNNLDSKYYIKDQNNSNFQIDYEFTEKNYFHLSLSKPSISIRSSQSIRPSNFYGLTAFRYIPQITKSQIGGQQVNPYKLFIEEEKDKFDQNIDILFNKLLNSLSDNNNDFAQDFIHRMQTGFVNIFGSSDTSLNFKNYQSPIIGMSPVRFIFSKGNNLDIDYSYLSAGEKMIFIILFDLYLNVSKLTDTIIYLDELDSHLNTSLQKNLLQEITENWIPEGCQLWTASHSLGFIEYAREYEKGVIIDLDNLDFDIPQVVIPSKNNSLEVFEIAVPKETVFKIFQDKELILCENQNDEYYNKLNLDNKLFIGQKDKETVISQIKNQSSFFGLIDKDYLTSNEIGKIRDLQKNLFILKYYSFENYLYHPDNLQELSDNNILKNWNKAEYIENLINKKNKIKIDIGESLNGRKNYSLLKLPQLENKRDQEKDIIKTLLESDKFEDFYSHFDIKKYGTPNLNLAKKQLISTKWFKEQISQLLKKGK